MLVSQSVSQHSISEEATGCGCQLGGMGLVDGVPLIMAQQALDHLPSSLYLMLHRTTPERTATAYLMGLGPNPSPGPHTPATPPHHRIRSTTLTP